MLEWEKKHTELFEFKIINSETDLSNNRSFI